MMRNYIKRLLNLFNHKYDLVDIINRDKENTFFCERSPILLCFLPGQQLPGQISHHICSKIPKYLN